MTNTPIIEWFKGLNLSVPSHYNQAVALKSARRLNPHALEDALRLMCACHEVLRARWNGSELSLGELGGGRLVRFEEHDLRKVADERAETERIADALQASINLADGPLLHSALVHLKDADAVLVVIHHLAVDGVSWRVLIEDLNAAYVQLLSGVSKVRLPRPRCSFEAYADALAAWAGGEELARELPYWTKVAEVARAVAQEGNRGGEDMTAEFRVPAETAKTLFSDFAAKNGVEANDILLTALGRAWAKATGSKGLAISLEGHGREPFGAKPLALERTVGWFTTIYPVVLGVGGADFATDLKAVAATLREIPNKGFGYGALRYLAGHGELACPATMTFNYLGSFSEAQGGDDVLALVYDIPLGEGASPLNKGVTPAGLNCVLNADGLTGALRFDSAFLDKGAAEAVLRAFEEELNACDRS